MDPACYIVDRYSFHMKLHDELSVDTANYTISFADTLPEETSVDLLHCCCDHSFSISFSASRRFSQAAKKPNLFQKSAF